MFDGLCKNHWGLRCIADVQITKVTIFPKCKCMFVDLKKKEKSMLFFNRLFFYYSFSSKIKLFCMKLYKCCFYWYSYERFSPFSHSLLLFKFAKYTCEKKLISWYFIPKLWHLKYNKVWHLNAYNVTLHEELSLGRNNLQHGLCCTCQTPCKSEASLCILGIKSSFSLKVLCFEIRHFYITGWKIAFVINLHHLANQLSNLLDT